VTKKLASTHKKVTVLLFDEAAVKGYLSPANLGKTEAVEILTEDGDRRVLPIGTIKAVHFVRDLAEPSGLVRKYFLSRPKLDGLWIRLRFRDNDTLEGIIPNDLLGLLDGSVHVTPPDLHGNVMRVFVPRTALAEMTVLGVVGVAKKGPRKPPPAAVEAQTKLFDE
jgi:hypothetical protein